MRRMIARVFLAGLLMAIGAPVRTVADLQSQTAEDKTTSVFEVASVKANLPDPTREFRVQKRGLAQQVENLSADIGSWLARSKELRSKFELEDSPADPS